MKPLALLFSLCVIVSVVSSAHAGPPPAGARGLAVLPTPGAIAARNAAKAFAPYELPFRLPAKLKDNALYESEPFYAVVIRKESDPPCDAGEYSRATETFRLAAQKRFADRKVFADPQCPDMGAVSYAVDGTPKGYGYGAFIAIYAGKTDAEARNILARSKTWYPKSEIKRMRVGYSKIVQ